jgi:hypothetical protein
VSHPDTPHNPAADALQDVPHPADAEMPVLTSDMTAAILQARRLFENARSPRVDLLFLHLHPLLKRARMHLRAAIQGGDESVDTAESYREVCYFLGGRE